MADTTPSNPILYVPSDRAWLDPRLIGKQLYMQYADIPVTTAGVVNVAIINYNRWAIGFSISPAFTPAVDIGPWPDTNDVVGWHVLQGSPLWFDQLTYGPLIGGPWYGFVAANSSLRVTQILRLP